MFFILVTTDCTNARKFVHCLFFENVEHGAKFKKDEDVDRFFRPADHGEEGKRYCKTKRTCRKKQNKTYNSKYASQNGKNMHNIKKITHT